MGLTNLFLWNGLIIDEKITHLAEDMHTCKHIDHLLSLDENNTLHDIYKDFVVVPINKATENITLICKIFHAFVIT